MWGSQSRGEVPAAAGTELQMSRAKLKFRLVPMLPAMQINMPVYSIHRPTVLHFPSVMDIEMKQNSIISLCKYPSILVRRIGFNVCFRQLEDAIGQIARTSKHKYTFNYSASLCRVKASVERECQQRTWSAAAVSCLLETVTRLSPVRASWQQFCACEMIN
jgi:hypothetical protein